MSIKSLERVSVASKCHFLISGAASKEPSCFGCRFVRLVLAHANISCVYVRQRHRDDLDFTSGAEDHL